MSGGLDILPVILGVFAISQLLSDTLNIEEEDLDHVRANMRGHPDQLRRLCRHGWNMLRSSLIGIGIGILPGVGATIASIVAYTTAKNASTTPEEFGRGSEEAIVAAESANNATTGGTLIPLLTLGIPGGLADSVLLGALVIHNLAPGPMLYTHHPEIVNAMHGQPSGGACADVRLHDRGRAAVRPADAAVAGSGSSRPCSWSACSVRTP